jgi:L-iditol 2-dehydrogenase
LSKRLGAQTLHAAEPVPKNCADVVFDTSGSAAACATLFSSARPGGCVVQVGWPGGNLVTVNVADFLDRELDYVAVNRYANAFPAALTYLADGRIDGKAFITQRYDFSQTEEAFQWALNHPAETIKVMIKHF